MQQNIFRGAVVALLGVVSIAQVNTTVLAAPATHITRTPSRVPEIPIYGMGYNDRFNFAEHPIWPNATFLIGARRHATLFRIGVVVIHNIQNLHVHRLGVKPLCTHETDKRGMVDCIPRTAAGLSGGSDWSGGLNLGNNIGGGGGDAFCQQTCIQVIVQHQVSTLRASCSLNGGEER